MRKIIENVIKAGNYKLSDMQRKINQMWLEGYFVENIKDELMSMAKQGVSIEGEKPDYDTRFVALLSRIEALEKAVFVEQPEDEIEKWEPWDGMSNKYQFGAVVSHMDKIWDSIFKGQNVWEPGAVGTENMWVERVE